MPDGTTRFSLRDPSHLHFFLRKVHSLTGVFPLGVFLFEHFYTNGKALFGPEVFDSAVKSLHEIPYLIGVGEIVLLGIPLLFHGLYGLYIASFSSVNFHYYPKASNLFYLLQRLTGVVLLVFVSYHVWNTRLQTTFYGTEISYAYMAEYFKSAGVKAIYIIGILSAVFHLSWGLWSFLIKWGFLTTPVGQKRVFFGCMALFVLMSAVGIHILFSFQ